MINIHSRLEQWSHDDTTATAAAETTMHFRQRRSCPGAGLYRRLDDVRLVLQIHDELVYEVRPSQVSRVAAVVRECMEQAVLLHVPLEVKLSVGETWATLQPWTPPPVEQRSPVPRPIAAAAMASQPSPTCDVSALAAHDGDVSMALDVSGLLDTDRAEDAEATRAVPPRTTTTPSHRRDGTGAAAAAAAALATTATSPLSPTDADIFPPLMPPSASPSASAAAAAVHRPPVVLPPPPPPPLPAQAPWRPPPTIAKNLFGPDHV